ncbi:energy-coupling factor transporter transmembrane protein EcfT [Microbacterium sp. Marseille-Q6965]|uniref:energy-coupling factor transporter transmembrane component T family protein n=1 Tax=Microbacterium sp. Marseille-Q6965 TaxID=2965072 RepID=UPI0021B783E1|nr:energy-coupling factor transporter transmembrane protein EcfT [Microbacterium sp. Marseille-Q6965]
MIALYRPGTSPLHRAPAWAKLLGLALLALVVSLYPHTAGTALGAFTAVVLLFLLGGAGPREIARQLWRARWIVLILALSQGVFLGPEAAIIGTTRVVAVVLLAALVTLTSPMGELLEVLQGTLAPLRRLGVDPWRVAFTVSLAIAAVPVVAGFAAQVREAQRARGVRLGPRAVVTLLVLALRHGDDVADALTARGLA